MKLLDEKENQTIENAEQTEEEEARGQKQAEEEAQEQEQADDEEILSEEQLEIHREIAEYTAKIEALDAKLAELEAKKVIDDKRELMRKWCYTDEQINRYIGYIDGMTSEEIEQSIAELVKDIPPAGDNFADPSPFNGRAAKPKTVDHTEIGKHAFDRIKHKIFPWMR